jgi:hypothetical protein
MADPINELKAKVFATLKASAPLSALVGSRVYDVVPVDPNTFLYTGQYPYVALSNTDATEDSADCINALDISMQIDFYTYGTGPAYSTAQASAGADLVRRALKPLSLDEEALPTNALSAFEHRITRLIRAQDGLTTQAAITYDAIVEVL